VIGGKEKRRAHEAYAALVAQARNPVLYTQCGIPDTLDGRFDAIILHLFLFQRGQHDIRLVRRVNEAFVADMDRSLREMGVGDTGIGRRMKKMGQALMGRLQAYQEAWGNETAFREALTRNVYRGAETSPVQMEALLHYLSQATNNSWALGAGVVSAAAAA